MLLLWAVCGSILWAVPLSAQTDIPGPLVDPALSLYTGPVSVPLEIEIPALNLTAPILGVGLTLTNAMAAPRGIRETDPLWYSVFWYRGGGIPGNAGTATLAGHYNDVLGRPAVFAFLADVVVGDVILIRDHRTGHEIPFIVHETARYSAEEAADPAVLARIFGAAAVSGGEALSPVSDQTAHLTLITCDGTWVDDTFNLRLVVYATRAQYPF